jgi:putative transposase
MMPAAQREAVRALMTTFKLSERRACGLVGIGRSTCRYQSQRDLATWMRDRLRALAEQRRRFGYRRLTILLRREGLRVNHKRVYRLYREEGLAVRRRQRGGCAAPRPRPCRSRPASISGGRWTSSKIGW